MPAAFPIPGAKSNSRTLTGKDAPVIDYLNQQESVHQFLASAHSLVDASVSSYQRRGFKILMVSFGCTGGQHRSVYLAEQLAQHLREIRTVWKSWSVISNWRKSANEGDDSGRRPGHAPAAAHQRPPQGAGRPLPAARCWRLRSRACAPLASAR